MRFFQILLLLVAAQLNLGSLQQLQTSAHIATSHDPISFLQKALYPTPDTSSEVFSFDEIDELELDDDDVAPYRLAGACASSFSAFPTSLVAAVSNGIATNLSAKVPIYLWVQVFRI